MSGRFLMALIIKINGLLRKFMDFYRHIGYIYRLGRGLGKLMDIGS